MTLWIFCAIIIAAICFIIIYGVTVVRKETDEFITINSSSFARQFYLGRLREIDRDLKQGLIDQKSSEEARLEMARQLLAVERKENDKDIFLRRRPLIKFIIILSILAVAAFSLLLYGYLGNPEQPGTSFDAFMKQDPQKMSREAQIVRLEYLFGKDPENGSLADQLATAYLTGGMPQQAANSYLDAIRLNGESAPRLVGYGLALTQFEGGVITQAAEEAFKKAVQMAPDDYYPQIFLAASIAQDGAPQKAAAQLKAFLGRVPDNAPYRSRLEDLIRKYQADADKKRVAPNASKSNIKPQEGQVP